MFTFISIMAVGVLIGYPLRRKQSIHKIPVLIQIVVCLLLFILGLSIGTNKLIIGNLSYFCQLSKRRWTLARILLWRDLQYSRETSNRT